MQLMPGDIVLKKLDTFQSKRNVKDQWSESEYVVLHQVADDIPTYKVEMTARMLRSSTATGFSWWPLTPMPLGGSESTSEEGAAQSTLAELTPLEWESEGLESEVVEALTWCLASCVLLGWVDGILWSLPSVAPQPTLQGLGAGDGTWSLSDKEVH